MELKGKKIVITGSSDGIGREIALRLATEETHLILIARNTDKLKEVSRLAKDAGALSVQTYDCDLTDRRTLKQTVEAIISDNSDIDILINNAGIWQKLMPIDEIEEQRVDDVIETNLTAVIHMTRLLLPTLRERNEAAIINVSSKSGVVGQEGQSVYTASKYGVRGFTEVLKVDLKDTPIRVAGVYQSGTNTGMFATANQNFPIEKFTDPADLADVIAYMLALPPKIWLHDIRVQY